MEAVLLFIGLGALTLVSAADNTTIAAPTILPVTTIDINVLLGIILGASGVVLALAAIFGAICACCCNGAKQEEAHYKKLLSAKSSSII